MIVAWLVLGDEDSRHLCRASGHAFRRADEGKTPGLALAAEGPNLRA